jgi:hypothetical protein
MKGQKPNWDIIDEFIILKNYKQLSWAKLLIVVNENRNYNEQVELSALRNKLKAMKLAKGKIQIRWHKKDIDFLLKNYKIKGDKEIAELLNKNNHTFRIIDEKKIYRNWKKKNIETKMRHIGLKRTHEEFVEIVRRNREIYDTNCFTKTNNSWTRGQRKPREEQYIRISQGRRFIKINGKFVVYARWLYGQVVESLTKEMIVYHKDFDCLNDNIDNLGAVKMCYRRSLVCKKSLLEAKDLLAARKSDVMAKMQKNTDHKKIKELMGESLRIKSIMEKIDKKLSKYKSL